MSNDVLPKFSEKPLWWKSSAVRTNRVSFKTSIGIKINADCNGAVNMIKKVAMMFKFDYFSVSNQARSTSATDQA
jgi:putative transposase